MAGIACQPGQGVLVQPPVFYHFIDFPEAYRLARQDAPLRRVDQGNLIHYDLDAGYFKQAIHSGGAQTGLFLLCNPHNPVGKVYSKGELEQLASACLELGIPICSDDIHNELLLGEAAYTPIASLSPEVAWQSVTLTGPGKAFNISGLCCAFAVISNTSMRMQFETELERQALEVNSLGLAAARAAYSGACDVWLAALRAYLTANRDYLVDYLTSELPGIKTSRPDATFLAWLDCSAYVKAGIISGNPAEFFLEQAKVALFDGESFGPGGEGFVRLNFACPRLVLEDALERLKQALHKT